MKVFNIQIAASQIKVKILPENIKLKSNVDVYLASDMLVCIAKAKTPINIVFLSCDGDYVETIKSVFQLSPNSCVTVLATPMTKTNNYLSIRLKHLSRELNRKNYKLTNINNIKDYISQVSLQKPKKLALN